MYFYWEWLYRGYRSKEELQRLCLSGEYGRGLTGFMRYYWRRKMAEENDKKKYRKKSWVRYERSHSLSAVYMDWYTHSVCYS